MLDLPPMFRNILYTIQYDQSMLDLLKDTRNIESVEIPEARQVMYIFHNYFNEVGWKAKKSLPCKTVGKVTHKKAIYPINKFTVQYYASKRLNVKALSKILDVPAEIIKSHMKEWGYIYTNGKWVKQAGNE